MPSTATASEGATVPGAALMQCYWQWRLLCKWSCQPASLWPCECGVIRRLAAGVITASASALAARLRAERAAHCGPACLRHCQCQAPRRRRVTHWHWQAHRLPLAAHWQAAVTASGKCQLSAAVSACHPRESESPRVNCQCHYYWQLLPTCWTTTGFCLGSLGHYVH